MDGTKDTVLLFLEAGVEDEVTKYDYDPANAVSEFSTGCESETSRRHPPVSHQVNIDKTYHNNGGSLPPPECHRGVEIRTRIGVSVWAVMLRCPFLSRLRHDEARRDHRHAKLTRSTLVLKKYPRVQDGLLNHHPLLFAGGVASGDG